MPIPYWYLVTYICKDLDSQWTCTISNTLQLLNAVAPMTGKQSPGPSACSLPRYMNLRAAAQTGMC